MRSDERSSEPRMGIRSRAGLLVTGVALALALAAGPVSATHTDGTLDCGSAGTYEVQAASAAPPNFEAPVPWSGLFLLEGTNRVFRAFTIDTPRWSINLRAADRNPKAVVSCTLTSSGFNFDTPWTMTGLIVP